MSRFTDLCSEPQWGQSWQIAPAWCMRPSAILSFPVGGGGDLCSWLRSHHKGHLLRVVFSDPASSAGCLHAPTTLSSVTQSCLTLATPELNWNWWERVGNQQRKEGPITLGSSSWICFFVRLVALPVECEFQEKRLHQSCRWPHPAANRLWHKASIKKYLWTKEQIFSRVYLGFPPGTGQHRVL